MLEFLRIKRKMSLTENLNVNTLENPLWEAACNIRGDIGAPKYKDYILPLIFLKMEPQGVSAGCCPKPLVQKQLIDTRKLRGATLNWCLSLFL